MRPLAQSMTPESRAESRALFRAAHNLAHSSAHHPTARLTNCAKASCAQRNNCWERNFRKIANSARGGRALGLACLMVFAAGVGAGEADAVGTQAKAFVENFCVGCHNAKKDSGGLNLTAAN